MEQLRSIPGPYFCQVSLHLCVRCKLGQGLSALSTLQQSACDPASIVCCAPLCRTPAAGTQYLLINKLAVLDAGSQGELRRSNPSQSPRDPLIPSISVRWT